jgi:TPR repeat protein
MDVKEISPKKLKSDGNQQTLWYKGDVGDLFIIFEKRRICHFEVTFENRHLEGGEGKSMKYGLVDSHEELAEIEDVLNFKKSRIVKYETIIPKDFVDQAIELVHHSSNLERTIADGLMKYLSTQGKDDTGLSVDDDFTSFREIEAESINFKALFWQHRNKIILIAFLSLVFKLSYNLIWRGDLKDACKKGSDIACANLGMINLAKGSKNPNALWIKSRSQNVQDTKDNCSKGDMESCYKFYDNKMSASQSEVVLAQLHEKSCLKHNHPRGCYHLGVKELNSNNLVKGLKLLQIACNKKYKNSCLLIQSEKDFDQNTIKCLQNISQSCYLAGMKLLRDGKYDLALVSLKKACDQNVFESCMEIGTYYATDNQKELAKSYYKISCENNDYKACFNLKYLSANTVKSRKDLQKKYDKCLDNNESACSSLIKL